jgi:hypothetical protein
VLCGNETPGCSMHETSSVDGFFGSMPPRSSTASSGFVSAVDHIVRTLRITTWFESDTLSENPGVSITVRFSIVSPSMCENERPSGELLPWKSRIVLRGPWPVIVTPSLGRPVSPERAASCRTRTCPRRTRSCRPSRREERVERLRLLVRTVRDLPRRAVPGTPQLVQVGAYGSAFWQLLGSRADSGVGRPSAAIRTACASWPLHEPLPVTSQRPGPCTWGSARRRGRGA